MGWTSSSDWRSLEAVVNERVGTHQWPSASHATLAHVVTREGDTHVLWTVNEVTYNKDTEHHKAGDKERYIGCDLIQKFAPNEWGYKDMEESIHPYFYSCPLEFLNMAPAKCEHWRANVREYHSAKRARRRVAFINDAEWQAMQAQNLF